MMPQGAPTTWFSAIWPKRGDAGGVELEAEVGVEAGERADLHSGRAADADVHRHGAQQHEAEAIGQADGLLLEQRENAAADVGSPGDQRVGLAKFAKLGISAHAIAGGKVIERDAGFDGQAAFADLHCANAQGAVRPRLEGHQHPAAEDGFADVGAGVIRNAAHDIEPGRYARDPNLAAVEEPGKAGDIAVGFGQ